MIDQLKDLKDTYESVRSQIDRGKEPLEDLIKVRNFLQVVAEDITLITEKAEKDFKRFFLDDFTIGILKRLTRERSKDDRVRLPFILLNPFSLVSRCHWRSAWELHANLFELLETWLVQPIVFRQYKNDLRIRFNLAQLQLLDTWGLT